MSKKLLLILAGLLLALAAAASVPLWSGWLSEKVVPPTVAPLTLKGFGPQADRFTIKSQGQTLAFEKKSGAWQVNGAPATEDTVKAFLLAVDATTVGQLVAKNPANHASLGVSDDTAYALHLEQGQAKLDLLVGHPLPDGQSFYLRQAGSNDVYSVGGTLRQLIAQPEASWKPAPPPAPEKPATPTKKKRKATSI